MKRGTTTESVPSRWRLYEHCVQNIPMTLRMVEAMHAAHARSPARILHEDFSGSAAFAHAWCQSNPKRTALAIDMDPEAHADGTPHPRLARLTADLTRLPRTLRPDSSSARAARTNLSKADIIYAGNFATCEVHTRDALVAYLSRARQRLDADGVFICDLYAGPGAWRTGETRVTHPPLPELPRYRVAYTWRQREADLLRGLVANEIDFALLNAKGVAIHELVNAFTYHWRLWSIPEMREAMAHAGFKDVDVYPDSPEAVDADGVAYLTPLDYLETKSSAVVYVCAHR